MSTTGCSPSHELFIIYFSEMFVTYRVSVMPCNPFGCGEKMEIDCFSQGGELSLYQCYDTRSMDEYLSLFRKILIALWIFLASCLQWPACRVTR